MIQTMSFAIAASSSSSSHHFGLTLSIKLQENKYLLRNQQVESVILAKKVHEVVVNHWIPQKFKRAQDQAKDKVSDDYKEWIVQDQAIFYMASLYYS